jgi:hypothetical protein
MWMRIASTRTPITNFKQDAIAFFVSVGHRAVPFTLSSFEQAFRVVPPRMG